MNLCVDASALLAVALREADANFFADQIYESDLRFMNPVNYWEALVRMRRESGAAGVATLNELVREMEIEVIPITADHARLAAETFARYGKNHPAKLNLGDCFAYATAKSTGATLLFKGNDFSQTDILP